MSRYNENVARFHANASAAGLTYDEAESLRRDAERVATWDTHECNGAIQWAEEGDKDYRGRDLKPGRPYWVTGQDNPNCPPSGYWTPRRDTQTPAIERVRALAEKIGARLEYNADPRGWPFVLKMDSGRDVVPPVRAK